MSFRQYLILMALSACLAWATWGLVLFGINPGEAGIGIFFLFYASLLIASASTLSILGFIVRAWILKKRDMPKEAGKSFRQAMLLSFFLVGMLYLQSKNILNWWTIILFIAILTLVEFFLISYKRKSA